MNFTITPLRILVFLLTALAVLATSLRNGGDIGGWMLYLRNFVFLAAPGFIFLFLLRRFVDSNITFRYEYRAITTLILFLLIDPASPWWIFPLVRIGVETFRHFIRTEIGPLFNPAALGAFALAFFGAHPDWWGSSFAPRFPLLGADMSIATLLTIPLAGFVAWRYRKLPLVFVSFLSFSTVFVFLVRSSPIHIILEGTFLFFILVMATEPTTSPIRRNDQFAFGGIIGSLAALFTVSSVTPDAFLAALLIANIFTHRQFIIQTFFPSSENGKLEI